MLQRAIQRYYTFFDETISSSTFIVLMITCLIFVVGSMSPGVHADNFTGNLREAMTPNSTMNTVIIDGARYQIQFTKVSGN